MIHLVLNSLSVLDFNFSHLNKHEFRHGFADTICAHAQVNLKLLNTFWSLFSTETRTLSKPRKSWLKLFEQKC